MVSRIARSHPRGKPSWAPKKSHRVAKEIERLIPEGVKVSDKIRENGLDYYFKSARLLTGTLTLRAVYRLEGYQHAPRK